MHFHPVFLSKEQIEKYYEGYSNSVIWPLCHYFFSYIQYDADFWETYREVNALFCSEALPYIADDDIVWVQDYQLMLLPKMIRDQKPNALSVTFIIFLSHLSNSSEFFPSAKTS